ncbi:hypothetical protein PYX06_02665 [Citrobacter amalonaticus]|nr:hypothetical protein [Citrobacter amalonaticus]
MVDYDQATFYGEIKWENPDPPNIYRQIKSTDLTEDDIFGYKKRDKNRTTAAYSLCIKIYYARISCRLAQ